MTNRNKTLIAALLDRSASMETSVEATKKGFNDLIKDQAKEDGQAFVTLAQFDDYYGTPQAWARPRWNWNNTLSSIHPLVDTGEKAGVVPEFIYEFQDITSVPSLTLVPRGNTPLLDAIGNFVTKVGKDLSNMREQDRPGIVIVVVMTDGQENVSKEWTASRVKDLIEQQENVYNWKFVFLGSNIDAVEVGAQYGFSRNTSMTYNDDSPVAVASAMATTSGLMSAYRGQAAAEASPAVLRSMGFTDEDRSASMDASPKGGRKDGESQDEWKARLQTSGSNSSR